MSRQLSDEDIARVAAEGAIDPADIDPAHIVFALLPGGDDRALAEQPLQRWLEGVLASYRGMKEVYALQPPQVPKQTRVYRDLETKVRAIRKLLDDNPSLVGDMIGVELSRLDTRPVVDDDQFTRAAMALERRVLRDVRALELLERRAKASRGPRRDQMAKPVGPAKLAVDDLTMAIFLFWHDVLRRKVLNTKGGVAIGSADAPSPLSRFACAVYRLAEGDAWEDPRACFETARARLKLTLAKSVVGLAPGGRGR